ncbi:hypothetical protein M513_10303 [Trichuris suis]|uniref:Galectin n=1 Tax=Trichuris suis TaxID=68888 RepID=A0A085LV23_9BILA|nr:hypothetical protein M513_10303 [Trichuris suis]
MSIAVESLTRSLASDTSGCLTAMVLDVENRIYAPKLPLISIIPNGMTAGKSILVKGLITGKHRKLCTCSRKKCFSNFAINLCCGLLTDGLHRDNIALHVNPRFDNEHKLVLNSLIDDTWGPEERHKNPLRKGQAFMIRITALPDLFKIAFNHDVTIEYLHRVPLSDIKTIQIEGCVIVDAMEYFAAPPTRRTDGLMKTPESARSSIKADPFILYAQALPFSLPVNYKEALPVLRFTMWVLKSPYRIEMDFLAGDDIAFHSSVRFDEQSIVRNVQRRGKWENEERLLDIFPFQPSCTYELEIHCLAEHFVVRVGGSHCYNFSHRLRPELIDRFNLKGNARLLKFCLE